MARRRSPAGNRDSPTELIIDLTTEPATVEFGDESIVLEPTTLPRRVRFSRRCVDIAGAVLLLALCAPMIALAALAVRLTSSGPTFYRSQRVGQGGRRFDALKLRTMFVDADVRLTELLADDPTRRSEYERQFKLTDDPRVTSVGRILRRTSIDELPQLYNILRGDMGLVGPRPKLPEEPDRYGPTFETVLRVKPGLTGLWQVSGRDNVSYDERIFLDLSYAMAPTFRGDVAICLRTAAQLCRPSSHGAS